MRTVIVLIMVLLLGNQASAEKSGVEEFKDYLPADIAALSKEERGKVPIMYLWAANAANSNLGNLNVEASLNGLMYDGTSDLEAAKRAFQKDLGKEPTGKLSVSDLHTLSYRAERVKLTRIDFFPYGFAGHIDANYATVKGTLKIHDDRISHPINFVKIDCERASRVCTYYQIALSIPNENSFAQTYNVSMLAELVFRVTKWDEKQIDAVPVRNNSCRTTTLSFNFETEEYYEIARNNTVGDCELASGVTMPKLEKPRISQVVDGREIVNDVFEKLRAEKYSYLSSAFRKKIQDAAAN
ncbi:MAG: hypothetical protein ISP41_01020 [Alphaproteobacteria bacterium]|nr:hypothetical protein [Alphaproteobacteria bacterium]